MALSKLDQAFALIREAVEEAYHNGVKDATERTRVAWDEARDAVLLKAMTMGGLSQMHASVRADTVPRQKQNRAGRGAPEALVKRILSTVAVKGIAVTPSEIKEYADTPEERQVSNSAIRLHLNKAQEAGWAKNIGRRWIYVDQEEKN